LLDARKALAMFQKLNVPILGLVENMSLFTCPNCGHESAIFTHGGAEKEAERLQVPFLGAIPLHMALRESADAGKPYVQVHQDSTCGVFQHAAEQIIHHLSHQVAA
ncbi:MAG: P-loop NTPase, partial [Holosporales bacterium]